jgi:hypothetical protein
MMSNETTFVNRINLERSRKAIRKYLRELLPRDFEIPENFIAGICYAFCNNCPYKDSYPLCRKHCHIEKVVNFLVDLLRK